MKVLVTGGSGFIGSNVVDKLLDEDHDVTIIDLVEPVYKSSAAFIKADVLNLDTLKKATKDMDFIYHLAAEANVNEMIKKPVYSTSLNTTGTLNILEAARQNNCRRVLFASTEWVYDASDKTEVDEETKLYKTPDHVYTSSKIISEMYLQNYKKLYDVDFTIMRFGIPFGPMARPATVHHIFVKKAFNNETITINGSGKQFRQFVYVEDLARGNVACLKEQAKNQIINLNGLEPISVKKIAETIKSIFDKPVRIEHVPAREADFAGRLVDSGKAERLLGWKPVIKYKDGVKKYIEWFKENEI